MIYVLRGRGRSMMINIEQICSMELVNDPATPILSIAYNGGYHGIVRGADAIALYNELCSKIREIQEEDYK